MPSLHPAFVLAAGIVALGTIDARAQVTLTAPKEVCQRELVSGVVKGGQSVFVVIHPLAVSTYYVQDRASVERGNWQLLANFGEPGRNIGELFELRAYVSPAQNAPAPGSELPDWPKVAPVSNQLTVKRKACG